MAQDPLAKALDRLIELAEQHDHYSRLYYLIKQKQHILENTR